jgi:hypothetical protein
LPSASLRVSPSIHPVIPPFRQGARQAQIPPDRAIVSINEASEDYGNGYAVDRIARTIELPNFAVDEW